MRGNTAVALVTAAVLSTLVIAPRSSSGQTVAAPASPQAPALPTAPWPAPAVAPAPWPDAAPAVASGERAFWSVRCTKGAAGQKRCTMLQNLMVTSGAKQQRLLTVLIQPDAKAGGMALLLNLPHGLFLPAGVQYDVDGGKPQKIVIQTSDANGSYAGAKLTPELLADLKKGRTLKVSVVSADRKTITIPVNLSGFTAAYDRLAEASR